MKVQQYRLDELAHLVKGELIVKVVFNFQTWRVWKMQRLTILLL